MEVINEETIVVDPWLGKTGTLSVITFILLSIFLTFATYDGATFYARFQQICIKNPDKTVCQNFNNPIIAPTKPKLDLVLDYDNGRYAIQVSAHKNEETAKNMVAQLQTYGIQPRIIKIKDSKRTFWHQVQLGRFTDKKIALQAAQQLKLKGIIQDFTVANYSVAK